jgi:hypothetical protein
LAAGFFDGHSERLSEQQSRLPDYWWPKGTTLPQTELNLSSFGLVYQTMENEPDQKYHIRR